MRARLKFLALFTAVAVAATCAACQVLATPPGADNAPASTIIGLRRLTETQYRHAMADAFGGDIKISGRFEPEQRASGLQAVGANGLSISSAGFAQYYSMAAATARQVVDAGHREKLVGCAPTGKPGDACSETVIRKYGRLLFRRPLTAAEISDATALSLKAEEKGRDAYVGLELALASLMVSPDFLFRTEIAEPDPKRTGSQRLDGYTKATRLSYLLWDAAPDNELLNAAESGDIHSEVGLARQVDRLMASPRMEDGVRAFFTDMLQFSVFETVNKDAAIYPKFSQQVAKSAREETLRVLVDHLITKNRDYRDLLTSRDTFIDRSLASIYEVIYAGTGGWVPYTFPESSGRSGLLTEVTFLSLFSHPGRSSPTKRGVALNEIFLCSGTPPPPPNVDFTIVNDVANPSLKTVRARLEAHALNDSCNFCHTTVDPLGLPLEQFDSLGQHRVVENGDLIDVASKLGGEKFVGAQGLGKVLHDNPRLPACYVRNVYAYAVGRAVEDKADSDAVSALAAGFANNGYRAKALLKDLVFGPDFFRPVLPKPEAPTK